MDNKGSEEKARSPKKRYRNRKPQNQTKRSKSNNNNNSGSNNNNENDNAALDHANSVGMKSKGSSGSKNRNGKPPSQNRSNGARTKRTNAAAGPVVRPEESKLMAITTKVQPEESPKTTKVHISDKRFADMNISKHMKRAIREVFKYELMTVVQAETLPIILQGKDVLARSKTGTGKTLAFLIPAIETIARGSRRKSDYIQCLVLSPTRELAMQISKEAESLTKFIEGLRVVTCIGGTNMKKDQAKLRSDVSVLVSTPGRLNDHLENTADLVKRLEDLKVLILDEADQLLDMGFRPEIKKILSAVQPSAKKRQTLLFTATVPTSINEIASMALKPDHQFIDTVGEDEDQTHLHVKQELMISPLANLAFALEAILMNEIKAKSTYKIMVFFTTARLTGFMANLFNSIEDKARYEVLEIHSRMSQPARKKCSEKFRKANKAILFSSDVSARGMDYPDVSFVLQLGLTERAQYIHRLGRTARAGKQGKGCLLLVPFEKDHMIKELSDLPLEETPVPHLDDGHMEAALANVEHNSSVKASAEAAYRAWIGYYNSHTKKLKMSKEDLVDLGNQWANDVGLEEQPAFERKTIGKMGLKGVAGLKIESAPQQSKGNRRR